MVWAELVTVRGEHSGSGHRTDSSSSRCRAAAQSVGVAGAGALETKQQKLLPWGGVTAVTMAMRGG